jgi:hypothetical protein
MPQAASESGSRRAPTVEELSNRIAGLERENGQLKAQNQQLKRTLYFALSLPKSTTSNNSKHSIRAKSDDGSILTLDDGSVWEVDSYDRYDSRLWMRMDNVILLDDSIINTDENNEKVGVKRIQ